MLTEWLTAHCDIHSLLSRRMLFGISMYLLCTILCIYTVRYYVHYTAVMYYMHGYIPEEPIDSVVVSRYADTSDNLLYN